MRTTLEIDEELLKKIDHDPELESSLSQREIEAVEAYLDFETATITIKDLIEGLVKNPEWAHLLSKNEGDALFYYYHLNESYNHELYDTKSSTEEIGQLFINGKTGAPGVKRQAINGYLDSAKRKLIGLYLGAYTESDAKSSKAEGTSSLLYNRLLEINNVRDAA
jgi:hypothetical protein